MVSAPGSGNDAAGITYHLQVAASIFSPPLLHTAVASLHAQIVFGLASLQVYLC